MRRDRADPAGFGGAVAPTPPDLAARSRRICRIWRRNRADPAGFGGAIAPTPPDLAARSRRICRTDDPA
jgi:hypothetical protein